MNRIFIAILAAAATLANTSCRTASERQALPQIYDPHADGQQQLAAAVARAAREQKRVLLDLGANWCSDSQQMFRLLRDDPEIRRAVERHYVLVLVDVNERGALPRNPQLVAQMGHPLGRGIPVLLILDSTGKLLNRDAEERLDDSDHEHPDKVLSYLRKWAIQATP